MNTINSLLISQYNKFKIARSTTLPQSISYLLFGLYLCIKTIKFARRKLQFTYEAKFVPFIVSRIPWLLLPFAKILEKFNICFLANIACGVGHTLPELDAFFRMRHLNEIPSNKHYIWIQKSDAFAKTAIELYGHKFSFAASSTFIYNLCLPFLVGYPELILDCGHSRCKWHLTQDRKYFPAPIPNASYLYQVSKHEGQRLLSDYFQRAAKCPDYFPLADTPFDYHEIRSFIGLNVNKIALIHLKDEVRNATALITDPATYFDSIEYLKDLGYTLVFVGREKMPDCFKKFGIINYAESKIASFKNDLALFHLSSLMIMAGSGASFLADTLGKPYLYLNSWHASRPNFSKMAIFIPALIKNASGRTLSLYEQIEVYNHLEDFGAEDFPSHIYSGRNATADEILMALKELLDIMHEYQEPNLLQEKLRTTLSNVPLYYSQSRCSAYFLQKHSELIDV